MGARSETRLGSMASGTPGRVDASGNGGAFAGTKTVGLRGLGKRTLPRHHPCWHLDLRRPAHRTVSNWPLLLLSPRLWFVCGSRPSGQRQGASGGCPRHWRRTIAEHGAVMRTAVGGDRREPHQARRSPRGVKVPGLRGRASRERELAFLLHFSWSPSKADQPGDGGLSPTNA